MGASMKARIAAIAATVVLSTGGLLYAAGFDGSGFPGGGAAAGAISALYCALDGCTMTGTLNTPTIANAGSAACNSSTTTGGVCINDTGGTVVTSGSTAINNGNEGTLFVSNRGTGAAGILISGQIGTSATASNFWGVKYGSDTGSIVQQGRVGSSSASVFYRVGLVSAQDSGTTPLAYFDVYRDDGTLQTPSTNTLSRPAFMFRNNAITLGHVSANGLWRTAGVDPRTIADNGAGTNATLNLDMTAGNVVITCSDANGCDVTIQDTTIAALGAQAHASHATICAAATNVVNVNFADNANQFNGAAPALGASDCFTMVYLDAADDLWVQTGASNN